MWFGPVVLSSLYFFLASLSQKVHGVSKIYSSPNLIMKYNPVFFKNLFSFWLPGIPSTAAWLPDTRGHSSECNKLASIPWNLKYCCSHRSVTLKDLPYGSPNQTYSSVKDENGVRITHLLLWSISTISIFKMKLKLKLKHIVSVARQMRKLKLR